VGPERAAADEDAAGRVLTAATARIPDPGDLIALLPGPAAVGWVRRGEGLVGWGEAARLTLPAGADRFTAGEKWLRELFDDIRPAGPAGGEAAGPGRGPVAFGSFTFDAASEGSVLIVPRVLVGRRDGRAWLTTVTPAGRRPPGRAPGPRPPGGAPGRARLPAGPADVRWSDGSLSAPRWARAVAAAVARIRAGELSKVVLARDLLAVAPEPVDTRLLLARLAGRYPGCYTFCCAGLVGATPELLIRREGQAVRSLVLAGTAPRGGSPAEDDGLGAGLLASAKNVEEHGYAVADVRAALAPLCADLSVAARPALLRLANVQHLATTVAGRLASRPADQPSALALAAALHPTAAVGGAPSGAAIEVIRELEEMDRGRYAGPVGWVDAAGNGEWGIALRCAQVDGPRARLFAGCGIVADSDPAAELAETQAKFRPVQQAIEG
jgi:menaquinone-specific isochorismate synthase